MDVTRLFDLLDNYVEKYPNQDAALACKRDGAWLKFSIQEYIEKTNNMSYGMLELGIKPGDKVGIPGGPWRSGPWPGSSGGCHPVQSGAARRG
jgi:long-chain acyl-CoA synthetase